MTVDLDRRYRDALETLHNRQAVVRDRVRGVALKLHTGLYLFGRAGTGKTYGVRHTLESTGVPYHYHNGHLTDLGVFDLLEAQHDRVIVLDDVSSLFERKVGLQLLLAALGNQPDETGQRVVKYRRQGRDETIRFTGGIIAISNLELHSAPLLQALKSRVHYLKYDPTEDQIAALFLDIAGRGWPASRPLLSARECRSVAEFLIEEAGRRAVPLDIRMLVDKAFPDYLQHRSGNTEAHWKDLVRATLEEQLIDLTHTAVGGKTSRADRKKDEQEVVRDILAEYSTKPEQLAAWRDRVGKSDRAFYRRLEELGGA